MKSLILIILISVTSIFAQKYENLFVKDLYLNSNSTLNNNSIIFTTPTLSSSITFTLPPTLGSNNFGLSSLGNGSLTWTDFSGFAGGTAGANEQIQFNSSGVFGANSNLVFDELNTYVGIGLTDPTYSLEINGPLKVGSNSNSNALGIYSEQGVADFQILFKAADAMASSVNYTWPNTDGTVNQILSSDGSGNFVWVTDGVANSNNCVGEGEDKDPGTNSVTSSNGFIGGGDGNDISSGGTNGFIGGGQDNVVAGNNSVVFAGEDNENSGCNSMIGGGRFNIIRACYSVIFTGEYGLIDTEAEYSMIGAGRYNAVQSPYSAIGAGESNTIGLNASHSIIGAGQTNIISNSPYSGILAGQNNEITTSGTYSAIGAGDNNIITGPYSFIGAGTDNTISGSHSVIVSGDNNSVSGDYSGILGGTTNSVSGDYSFIIGNNCSVTVDYGFAFGRHVTISHEGSFGFGDGNTTTLTSSATNQFSARYSAGYTFYTNSGASVGSSLAGGGVWSTVSDSNLKSNILYINPSEINNKIKLLDISSWFYKSFEKSKIRNYGPMAQDFYKLFGKDRFGTIGSPTTINVLNLSSIGILALQGSNIQLNQNNEEIEKLKIKLNYKKERVKKLKEILNELEELKRK